VINRTHIWFAAFVLIVFAGGVAAGVALDRSLWRGGRPGFTSGGPRGERGPGGPGRDGGSGRDGGRTGGGRDGGRGGDGPPTEAFVRELDANLSLTTEQEAKVTAIINASRPQMRALQEEASKKFAAEQKSLHDEIVKVLTPEQAKKFEETSRGPFGFRWRGGRGGR
jgi:hypothetical protein